MSKLVSLPENAGTYLAFRLGDRSSAKAREERSRATLIIGGFSLTPTGTKTARHVSNQPDCGLYQAPSTLPSLPNLPQVIEEPLK